MSDRTVDAIVKIPERGERLFQRHGVSWWPVESTEQTWRDALMGHFVPVDQILTGESLFGPALPEGTYVRVTVEVVKERAK
jgi:hypothetical protein